MNEFQLNNEKEIEYHHVATPVNGNLDVGHQ
jgi:hypothetical protein